MNNNYKSSITEINYCKSKLKGKNCYKINGKLLHLVKKKQLFNKFKELYNISFTEYYALSKSNKKEKTTANLIGFLGHKDFGVCMIVYTNNIQSQIQEMQPYCPYEVEVLGVMNGVFNDARKLHGRFAKYNMNGLWFRFEGELKSFCNSGYKDHQESVEKTFKIQ